MIDKRMPPLRPTSARGELGPIRAFRNRSIHFPLGPSYSARLHRLLSSVADFSAGGKRVLTASHGRVRIWDAESGNEIAVLQDHDLPVTTAALSADGKRVVTAYSDNTARIWDAERGKEITVLKGHTDEVRTAAFSGDDKRVVTASSDKTARIWDVTWATLVRGDALRDRVCAEKLVGAAQQFTDGEIQDDP